MEVGWGLEVLLEVGVANMDVSTFTIYGKTGVEYHISLLQLVHLLYLVMFSN